MPPRGAGYFTAVVVGTIAVVAGLSCFFWRGRRRKDSGNEGLGASFGGSHDSSGAASDHAVTREEWDVLLSLPTECELVRRVKETARVTAAANAADAPKAGAVSETPSRTKDDGDGEGGKQDAERSTVPSIHEEFHGRDSGPGDGGSRVISAVEAWTTLLPVERNWHKTVYTLQIIDALLLPASQVLGAQPSSPQTDAFRSNFLQGGGFARVLNVALTAPDDGDRHTILGHASLLRIIKTCLFYPPLQVLTTRHDHRAAARDRGQGGGGGGGGSFASSPDEEILIPRALPPMSPLSAEAREAMKVAESDLHRLLNKLVLVSLSAQRRWLGTKAAARENEEEESLCGQVIMDCLAVVGSVLGEHPSMMAALSKNPSVREFVVSTLARNPSSRVRRQMGQLLVGSMPMAGTLLRWLTVELEELPLNSNQCGEFFSALGDLLLENRHASSRPPTETSEEDDGTEQRLDLRSLAQVLSTKIMRMPRDGNMCTAVLLGCLEVVRNLIEIEGPDGTLLDGTELGKDLVGSMFNGLLFMMPEQREAGGMSLKRPVCTELSTRRAAMNVMASAARKSPKVMSALMDNVAISFGRALPALKHWGGSMNCGRQSGVLIGLKNQGATCYMNAVLQQLFMVPGLRKAILEATIPRRKLEDFPRELVGRRVSLPWESGGSLEACVIAYDEQTGYHRVRYDTKEEPCFRLGEGGGRPGKETGAVSIVWGGRSPSRGEGKTMTQDEASLQVLEQVQRTFLHLRDGKGRFFDPIRLVDACRCLNLQFPVNQQNDAGEFCEELLNRVESGMRMGQLAIKMEMEMTRAKAEAGGAGGSGGVVLESENGIGGGGGVDEGDGDGEGTGENPRAAALDGLLGGTYVQQKISTGCSHRTNMSEPFINLQVKICGSKSLEESLAKSLESELLTEDRKAFCDDCGEYKDARMRTCLGRLPNLLIVHLQRFTMDSNTFQAVKLNDRCSFPMVLDVKPYTTKGIDEREALEKAMQAAVEASGGDPTIEQPAKMEEDAGNYLYNLVGILVHSGGAGHGHCYSYIRDRGRNAYQGGDGKSRVDGANGSGNNSNGSSGSWFKFNDDRVTPFNPREIETSCFGGVAVSTTGVTTVKHERTANAFLLFYEKAVPREESIIGDDSKAMKEKLVTVSGGSRQGVVGGGEVLTVGGVPLLDGVEAFSDEVWQANAQFGVLDTEFFIFLRDVVAATVSAGDAPHANSARGNELTMALVNEWGHSTSEASLRIRVLQMGINLLLGVILPSGQERGDVKAWEALLQRALAKSPDMCRWFLESLLERSGQDGPVYWLRQIMLECRDIVARQTAVRLIAHACCCYCRGNQKECALLSAAGSAYGKALHSGRQSESLVARVLASVSDLMSYVGRYNRSFDDLVVLVRDLAMGENAIRLHLMGSDMAARLAIFILRDDAPQEVRQEFSSIFAQRNAQVNHVHLLESISAVLGAQPLPKADLLEDPAFSSGVHQGVFGHAQGSELTSAAKSAFTEIFRRQSSNDGMDMRQLRLYMKLCGMSSKSDRTAEEQLINMINEHETAEGNQLSLEDFLSHYRELAATDPRQAWNDLYHMGYRSNLTVGLGYGNKVCNLVLPAKRFQGGPVWPELTSKTLTSLNFYMSAADLSSGVSVGAEAVMLVLRQVGSADLRHLIDLISQCRWAMFNPRHGRSTKERLDNMRLMCSVMLNLLRSVTSDNGKRSTQL